MPEIVETDGNGATALIEACVQIYEQARHSGSFHRIRGASREHIQTFLGFCQRSGEKFALGPLQLQRKGELVPALPLVFRQQGCSGGEMGERRSVGRRGLGALARKQVKFGQLLTLISQVDQGRAAVELVDYLEDRLLVFFCGGMRREQPSDTQVRLGAHWFRYE